VTGELGMIFTDLIEYRIVCNCQAIVQSLNNSITIAIPRNCVAVNGTCFSVAHLRVRALPTILRTIVIPYSLHTIFGLSPLQTHMRELEYLVFEFGSELQSISDWAFASSSFRSVLFPATVRFIGQSAFYNCSAVVFLNFARQSSLWQLSKDVFYSLASGQGAPYLEGRGLEGARSGGSSQVTEEEK
jgi:hypothetical protein